MSTVSAILPVPVERVFSLLEDPRAPSHFVVGTRTIRRFDPRWPALHTRIHHSVGVGPLVLRDNTEVIEIDAPHLLVLEARFRPVGVMRVEFHLRPHPDGTEFEVAEHPTSGPIAVGAIRPAVDAAITVRNHELLRRVRTLIDARESQREFARSLA